MSSCQGGGCVNNYIPRLDPATAPIGCFIHNNNDPNNDTLNGLSTLNSPSRSKLKISDPFVDKIFMDNGFCIKHCIDFKFKYAALQGGVNCRCGNALDTYSPVDSNSCDTPCKFTVAGGVVSYPCGGQNSSVYSIYNAVLPSYNANTNDISVEDKLNAMNNSPTCVIDSQFCGQRVLDGDCSSVSTVDECIEKCRKERYIYAGLEAGFQCFCGNKYDSLGLTTGFERCSSTCTGNSTQICGGSWALSIYDVPNVISQDDLASRNIKIGLGIGIPVAALLIIALVVCICRRCRDVDDKVLQQIDTVESGGGIDQT